MVLKPARDHPMLVIVAGKLYRIVLCCWTGNGCSRCVNKRGSYDSVNNVNNKNNTQIEKLSPLRPSGALEVRVTRAGSTCDSTLGATESSSFV